MVHTALYRDYYSDLTQIQAAIQIPLPPVRPPLAKYFNQQSIQTIHLFPSRPKPNLTYTASNPHPLSQMESLRYLILFSNQSLCLRQKIPPVVFKIFYQNFQILASGIR